MTMPHPEFRSASAIGEWPTAARKCAEAIADLTPPSADQRLLGFLYATAPLAGELRSIVTYLRQTTPVDHWIGAIGGGVVCDDREYHDDPAVSIMVARLPTGAVRPVGGVTGEGAGFDDDDRAWAIETTPTLGIVHANPAYADAFEALKALSAGAGGLLGGCFLIGGLAAVSGDDATIAGTGEAGAISGALFTPAVDVASAMSQGCTPLGEVHRVTEAHGDVIMAIDGRPALEVLKEDVGELLARDLSRLAGYVHAAFPVAGSDTGDYMVRNLVAIDLERGWIGIGGETASGDGILFVRRDPESARMDLIRMLNKLKTRLPDTAIRGGLYFSCIARGPSLFGGLETEAGIIQRELGPFPMTGFFGSGEISDARVYAYTGVLVLFT